MKLALWLEPLPCLPLGNVCPQCALRRVQTFYGLNIPLRLRCSDNRTYVNGVMALSSAPTEHMVNVQHACTASISVAMEITHELS